MSVAHISTITELDDDGYCFPMSNLKFISLLALASVATLASADSLTKKWQVRYDALSKLVVTKDFNSFQKLIADDYVWVQPDGKQLNRKDTITAFAPIFQMKKVTGGEKVTKVVKKGDTFEVTFDARWSFVGPDGKAATDKEVGVDTWRKVKGEWNVVKTVDKAVKL